MVSQANGEDPAGTGKPFTGYLLVEVAPPWKYDVGESSRFPESLWEAVKGLWNASIVEKFTAIMPNPEYSREGHTRVTLLRKPSGPFFAAYEKEEYLAPEGEVVALVEALAKEPDGPSRFACYREDDSRIRDILVCTEVAKTSAAAGSAIRSTKSCARNMPCLKKGSEFGLRATWAATASRPTS